MAEFELGSVADLETNSGHIVHWRYKSAGSEEEEIEMGQKQKFG